MPYISQRLREQAVEKALAKKSVPSKCTQTQVCLNSMKCTFRNQRNRKMRLNIFFGILQGFLLSM